MLEIHTSTFRVRHYECDALGHLNNANYLRYMLESAIHAFTLIGVDQTRLSSLSYSLRARSVYIEYIRPFTFEDLILVKTMIRVLWDDKLVVGFEFQKERDEKAYAISNIAYELTDTDSDQKVQIPSEIRKELMSLERWEIDTEFEETFQGSSTPSGAYSMPWRIEWRDVGSNQTLNIASYLDYLIDFVLMAAADCGWTHKRSMDEGIVWVVKRQWLKILHDAVFEDELILATWISEFKRSTVTREYSIRRAMDDTLIAKARTLWIALDAKSGRPRRIPEVWKRDFASQIFTNGITQSS